jgi:hypothetical protein
MVNIYIYIYIYSQRENWCWDKKLRPLFTVSGSLKCAATMEDSIEVPQQIKNGIIMCSNNFISRYIRERVENRVLKISFSLFWGLNPGPGAC